MSYSSLLFLSRLLPNAMPIKPTNYLGLDLEINEGSIVQVGVCIGNVYDSEEDYLTLSWYVKPTNDLPITPFITELTGIEQRHIDEEGIDHETLAATLSALIVAHDTFLNPVQWGHADAAMLLKEFKEKGVHFPYFGRRVIDVKTIHGFLMVAEGRSPSGGLKSALKHHKVTATGTAHDAKYDALNTLKLYFHLLRGQ